MTEEDPQGRQYTLAEARQVIALDNCRNGHTDMIEIHSGGEVVAIRIVCQDCGTAYVKEKTS